MGGMRDGSNRIIRIQITIILFKINENTNDKLALNVAVELNQFKLQA